MLGTERSWPCCAACKTVAPGRPRAPTWAPRSARRSIFPTRSTAEFPTGCGSGRGCTRKATRRSSYDNPLNYARGEGRLWGFGIHSIGGGYTRKPVVYWSDDNGASWHGPELLHGPMYPGTDTGYGDMKRRTDGTFVAATYYANRDSTVADLEQYTFGIEEARVMIEADRDGDGIPDASSAWRQLYNGPNAFAVSDLKAGRWRLRLLLCATDVASSPHICNTTIIPR